MARTLGPVRKRWWSLAPSTVLDRAEHASTCLQALPFHSLQSPSILYLSFIQGVQAAAGFLLLPEPVGSSPASPEPGQIWNDKTLTPSMLSWLVSKMRTETSLRDAPDEGISVLPALTRQIHCHLPRVLPSPYHITDGSISPQKSHRILWVFKAGTELIPTALQLWQFAETTL